MALSRQELDRFTRESDDPSGRGRVTRPYDNVDLTDEEIVNRINQRNMQGKASYLLRLEYERRLNQRGL